MDYVQYLVTAYQCSHLSKVYIEQMKRDLPGGEHGAAFKSHVMAEFGTTDEMVVIPHTYSWRAIKAIKIGHLPEPFNTAGLDLSAGGDETVLSVRNGNKQIACIPFRFDNTQDTIAFLSQQFEKYELKHPSAKIFADAGGLGKPIIDSMRAMGWTNIRYVLNQAKAYDERVYYNRGAEMWFNFGKLLEHSEIWLLNDDKQKTQLSTRYYKITPGNIHQLESKLAARAKGHPSPDRADALVLSFCNYKSKLDEKVWEKPFEKEKDQGPPVSEFTMKEWANRGNKDSKSAQLNPSRHKNFSVYKAEIKRMNEQIKSANVTQP